MNPKVTVYLVNHNYGKYITKSINSILKQTYKNIELIIIDDGSTDSSLDILKKYEKNKNIKLILQKNKGLIVTNNIALNLAKGEYILRVDADDWLDENAVEIMVKAFENQKNLALVFPDYFEVNKNGNFTRIVVRHNFKKVTLHDQPAHGACTMFKTKILKELGGYDEELRCQDGYDIWLKIINRYDVKNINLPLFYYRQHNKSLTKKNTLILNTRSQIFKKAILRNNIKKKTIGIIPIRGSSGNSDSYHFKKILGKNLIDWTIESLLKINSLNRIILTSPDKKIINYINDNNHNKNIIAIHRNENLAKLNETYFDSIIDAINKISNSININEYSYLVACIEAPFRSTSMMEMALNSLILYQTNCVIPVKLESSNFYKHDGKGLSLINLQSNLRLESSEIYREAGDFKVFTLDGILNYKSNTNKIGHIIVDEYASFNVLQNHGWETANLIAKKYLKYLEE